MKVISFNVNGIRSIQKKSKNGTPLLPDQESHQGSLDALIAEQDPEVLCLQEIKTHQSSDLDFLADRFPYRTVNVATTRKGYSGVALCSKVQPEHVSVVFEEDVDPTLEEKKDAAAAADLSPLLREGRIITAIFPACVVVTVYVPNAQEDLARIELRLQWERSMSQHLTRLRERYPDRPLIVCGDLNVAPEDRDIHRPQPKNTPGASPQEREAYRTLLQSADLVDSFRVLHPDDTERYSFWSYMAQSRARNRGWRIDFVLVSREHMPLIQAAECLPMYHGSDHCPVMCVVDVGAFSL